MHLEVAERVDLLDLVVREGRDDLPLACGVWEGVDHLYLEVGEAVHDFDGVVRESVYVLDAAIDLRDVELAGVLDSGAGLRQSRSSGMARYRMSLEGCGVWSA